MTESLGWTETFPLLYLWSCLQRRLRQATSYIYVMLTRARKLKNLILLGFTEQVEELLRKGPPTYLRELTDKLEAKAASTLERLQSWPVYDALQAS